MHFFFSGKKVLLTAGPTHEPIDPVRFIGNRSSGKMGYAIAAELALRGAEVFLVSGPVSLRISHDNIHLIKVNTADEMYNASIKCFQSVEIAILAAAVADYTPINVSDNKIKKKEDIFVIELKKTKDILAALGQLKQSNQILVGFSLETENELENSRKKMLQKNCDFIVINSLREEGAGFSHDTNKITILDRKGNIVDYPLKSKEEVAKDICNYIEAFASFKDE